MQGAQERVYLIGSLKSLQPCRSVGRLFGRSVGLSYFPKRPKSNTSILLSEHLLFTHSKLQGIPESVPY